MTDLKVKVGDKGRYVATSFSGMNELPCTVVHVDPNGNFVTQAAQKFLPIVHFADGKHVYRPVGHDDQFRFEALTVKVRVWIDANGKPRVVRDDQSEFPPNVRSVIVDVPAS